jgi:hypothetical protein
MLLPAAREKLVVPWIIENGGRGANAIPLSVEPAAPSFLIIIRWVLAWFREAEPKLIEVGVTIIVGCAGATVILQDGDVPVARRYRLRYQ